MNDENEKFENENLEKIINLPISLSYDHRIINGAIGVQFTSRLNEIFSDIKFFEENF